MNQPRPMTLGEHLEELRFCVLKAIGWVFLALIVTLAFQEPIMKVATWPHQRVVASLQDEAKTAFAAERMDGDAIDLVLDASERDVELQRALEEVDRVSAILRDRQSPSQERMEALVQHQLEVADKLDALRERQRILEDGDAVDAGELATLTEDHAVLTAEVAALQLQVNNEVRPFLDRYATVPKFELIQLRYQEGFLSFLKVSLVAALFLASPLVVFQLWSFVAAGLYPKERRYAYLFMPLSFGAFALGACFGYFILIPLGLRFLATYAPPDMVAGTFSLSDYLSLFIGLTLVVGAIFELPLVMTFLTMIGIVEPETFRTKRRYWILSAFVMGAILTPPDPVTQTLMAFPLLGLYEIGIVMSMAVMRRRKAEDEAEQAEATPVVAQPAVAAPPLKPSAPTPAPPALPAPSEATPSDATEEAPSDPEPSPDSK
ncbi:twin-arginine translocase subunit TatC, partial [Planctomycetota bacterium]|nr:twin-arginine translocase subunit TatC [Planctomycetota bacterium]